jgi:N-acetylglutamate synthase-like GNAT family acetyltransferase
MSLSYNATVRPATASDIPQIREVLKANDADIELEWPEDISLCWLVAEHEGKVIATVQYLIGKPMGAMLYWFVLPEYQMGGVGIYLIWAAEAILRHHGCQGYVGITNNPKVENKLARFGCEPIGEYTTFIKRL